MSPAHEYVAQIDQALRLHADAKRAIEMKAYLRGQFEFLGIQTPMRRAICKQLPQPTQDAEQLMHMANLLWQKPQREFKYVACDVLAKHVQLLHSEHLPALKKLLQKDTWWETVDSLSGTIGDVVMNEHQQGKATQNIMDTWLMDKDFWVRRSAMIHQLGWRLNTDTDRLGHYALTLSNENEFFIRKAIGWAFRDYAKWNPQFVHHFMRRHGSVFSNLTVREATKNLQ